MHEMSGADNYGWFSDVNARCDPWNQAELVGRTTTAKFVVCAGPSGLYLKAVVLVDNRPIRAAVSGSGASYAGDGVAASAATLTLPGDGGSSTQPVVQWWMAGR